MTHSIRLLLSAALLTLAQGAFAHDPAEHAKEAAAAKAKANCAAMKNIDAAKIDPNDPVMKAMMIKCSKQAAADRHSATAAPKAKPRKHGSH